MIATARRTTWSARVFATFITAQTVWALLLLGFAWALRHSELAAVRAERLELQARGLQLTTPSSKGVRSGGSVVIAIPTGGTTACPVNALYHWLEAAGLRKGAAFRCIWQPPAGGGHDINAARAQIVGSQSIDPRTVARIIQATAEAVGYAAGALSGSQPQRGALTAGMDRGVHPTRLKQHDWHESYAVLGEYLELGDSFDSHPL